MHEYSLMENVIESITKDLQKQGMDTPPSVTEVILKVGALDIHSEESFKQAFSMIAKGTFLENAQLDLQIIPARIECPKCNYKGDCRNELDGHDPTPVAECPKCGSVSMVQGGRGIEPIELILGDVPPTP